MLGKSRHIGSLLVTAFLLLLFSQTAMAGNVNGVIKLGTIIKDEDTKDMTAIQETYNIYEGFSVSQVRLNGTMGRRSSFLLDLNEINRDSGTGLFTYRVQDLAKVTVKYGSHRQLYDADGSVSSLRRDWRFGASVTPSSATRITANFGHQTRTGDRLAYPTGTNGVLGGTYDYTVLNGNVEAEVHRGARKLAVGWDMSSFTDDLNSMAERSGNVFSLRANGPCYLFPNLVSHYVRGAYGTQTLDVPELDYTMSSFQYLGLLRPSTDLQLKYRFYAGRIENDVTTYKTDNIRNDVDLTWYNSYGSLFGGYGYVTNDNDVSLTSYNEWRVGTALNYEKALRLQVSYANSDKTDLEEKTLLKDIEASRLKASLKSQPTDNLTLGVSYADRKRDFPVLGVTADGKRYSAFGRIEQPGVAAFSLDYTYSEDDYTDRVAGFAADNRALSGRVDFTMVKDLNLAAGLTYLNIGGDLDIEKSIMMFEGSYTVAEDYFVEVKYNVYNYDDYLMLDRYYTANVVWLNVGYKLSIN